MFHSRIHEQCIADNWSRLWFLEKVTCHRVSFILPFFQNAASVVCRPAIWQVQVWRLSHVVYNCNDITILPIVNWFFEQCLDFSFFVIRFTHSLKHRRPCWIVACSTRSIWHARLIANSCSEKTIDACLHNIQQLSVYQKVSKQSYDLCCIITRTRLLMQDLRQCTFACSKHTLIHLSQFTYTSVCDIGFCLLKPLMTQLLQLI